MNFEGGCRHTSQLSEAELRTLIRAQIRARGEPVAEDELERIASWVHQIRVSSAMVDMLLDGELLCRFPEGATDPTVELTPPRVTA